MKTFVFDARIEVHGHPNVDEAADHIEDSAPDGMLVKSVRPVLNYAVVQRLRFIEVAVSHCGQINRSALCEYFGISVPQASADIQQYIKLAPGNIMYDASRKTYVKRHSFVNYF